MAGRAGPFVPPNVLVDSLVLWGQEGCGHTAQCNGKNNSQKIFLLQPSQPRSTRGRKICWLLFLPLHWHSSLERLELHCLASWFSGPGGRTGANLGQGPVATMEGGWGHRAGAMPTM